MWWEGPQRYPVKNKQMQRWKTNITENLERLRVPCQQKDGSNPRFCSSARCSPAAVRAALETGARRPTTLPPWHPACQGVGDSQPKNRLSSGLALPPSPREGTVLAVQEKKIHPEKQQPRWMKLGGIFGDGGAGWGTMGVMSSITQGVPAWPPASGMEWFPPPLWGELQPWAPSPSGGLGTEQRHKACPCPPDAVPSWPTAKAKQLSLALVAAPALFPTRKLSPAIPLSCRGLCFNGLCNFSFKKPTFSGSKASQDSF